LASRARVSLRQNEEAAQLKQPSEALLLQVIGICTSTTK